MPGERRQEAVPVLRREGFRPRSAGDGQPRLGVPLERAQRIGKRAGRQAAEPQQPRHRSGRIGLELVVAKREQRNAPRELPQVLLDGERPDRRDDLFGGDRFPAGIDRRLEHLHGRARRHDPPG